MVDATLPRGPNGRSKVQANTRKKLNRSRRAAEKDRLADAKAQRQLEKQLRRPWRDAAAMEGCDVE